MVKSTGKIQGKKKRTNNWTNKVLKQRILATAKLTRYN